VENQGRRLLTSVLARTILGRIAGTVRPIRSLQRKQALKAKGGAMATVLAEKVSVDELRERLDSLTRQELNLSVDEFLGQCRDQTLDMSSPIVSRLALLARLIDEASRRDIR
jgi:hypothetical protein